MDKNCILIIDDDEGIRKSLALILRKKGFDVVTTGTGMEALEKAKSRNIHLAFLDIQLPDINGIQLIKPLKEIHPGISLIIMTGYASVETAVRSMNEGAHGYTTKPLNMVEVLKKINDIFERQLLIREKQQVEKALKESENRYRQLIDKTDMGFVVIDDTGIVIEANEPYMRLIGAENMEGIIGHSVIEWTAPEERDSNAVALALCSRQGFIQDFETIYLDRYGTRIHILINATMHETPGGRRLVSFCRNITERKRAEEALRNSEARLHTLVQTIPDLIWLKDTDGVYLSCNAMFERFFGAREADIVGKTDYDFVDRKLADFFRENERKAMAAGKPTSKEEWITFADDGNRALLAAITAPMYDSQGTLIGVLGIGHDITERKRAEEQVHESRQLFADIISFLPDPTFVIDKDGKVLAWNRALEQLSGVPANDIIGKGDYEYSIWEQGMRRPGLIDLVLHPDQDYSRISNSYTGILFDDLTVTAQTHMSHPEGVKTEFSVVVSPLYDSKETIVGAIESMRDITYLREAEAELARINQNLEKIVKEGTRALEEEVAQRMRAEKDVHEALDYARSVIEANPDLVVVLDEEGTILDVNPAGESLTGLPKEKLIGTPYFGYLVDDGNFHNAFSSLLHRGKIEDFIQIRRTDGHVTPLSMHAMVIRGRESGKDRIIVAAHDITRQKQDEDAIRASLDEKVLLLREIHHRVKNNLQIIISMTNLQMRQIDDPQIKKIVADTQNRVRAMSLVHEKLYRSESLSQIELNGYLRSLITQISSSYLIDTRHVKLSIDMPKIMIELNTAIPLGLVMNELIGNSLKHAFPPEREGTLSINGDAGDAGLTITLSDNGIGIPDGFDLRQSETLGLKIVTTLVQQINGTIELVPGPGTTWRIVVPKKE